MRGVNQRAEVRKALGVAVGMPVTRHPPHKTVRAQLTHTASALDDWRQSAP